MTKRILLAGILGGLVLFVWEFVAHMMLPLGEAGMKGLTNETAVIAALKEQVKEDGLYFFPAGGWSSDMTADQKRQAMEKAQAMMANGPGGLLLIHPNGMVGMTGGQLGTQCAGDIASMLLAAFVVAQVGAAAFGSRFLIAMLLSLLPAFRSHIPLWNWYAFPGTYTAAQITIDVVGFAAGGAIVAKMVQSRSRTMAAAA